MSDSVSWEELSEAEKRARLSNTSHRTQTETDEHTRSERPDTVDWGELDERHGINERDCYGRKGLSPSQMELLLSIENLGWSDVAAAVESGELVETGFETDEGSWVTRGYVVTGES